MWTDGGTEGPTVNSDNMAKVRNCEAGATPRLLSLES